MKMILATGLSIGLLAMVGIAANEPSHPVPEVVRARTFEVVGNNGAVLARLGQVQGDGGLALYGEDGKMMAAVTRPTAESFQYEKPKALFDAPWLLAGSAMGSNYDVTRDGRRFLFVAPLHLQSDRPQAFTLITNWLAGLRN